MREHRTEDYELTGKRSVSKCGGTIPLWQDFFFWGMIVFLLLREYNYLRYYYIQIGWVLLFVLISLLTDGRCYIKEFLKAYLALSVVTAFVLIYQIFVRGVSERVVSRTIGVYLLIYGGYLFGKRFASGIRVSFARIAVFLGVCGLAGLIWRALRICPLGFMSEVAVRYYYDDPNRMVSVFAHPILAACYMLLLIMITLFFWIDGHASRVSKYGRISLLLIGLAGLYATFTRSAYLVLLTVTLIWGISERDRIRKVVNKRNLCILVAAFIVLCIAFWFLGILPAIYNRFFGTEWYLDRSYMLRLDAFAAVKDGLQSKGIGQLLFGSGIGRGKRVLNNSWFLEKYQVRLIDNTYLSLLVDEGVLLLLLAIKEVVRVFIRCLGKKNSKIPYAALDNNIAIILFPMLLMLMFFDVQGWCSFLFVVCFLAGMEKAL